MFKHVALVALLRLLTLKDKPLLVVDSHAGAGMYSLEEGFAARNAEYEDGVAKLWDRDDLPALVADYVDQIHAVNPDGVLRRYPGSPWIARGLLRPQDRLRLFELHGNEAAILAENFADGGRRVSVSTGDGFAGVRSVLPPPSRRGLVLIDPSYELAADYKAVVGALHDGMQRFATGTYAVWYPLLQRRESEQLSDQLRGATAADWVDIGLQVKSPSLDGTGLHGSAMFIVNPPWKFSAQMREVMPWIVEALAQDSTASFRLDAHET